MSHRSKRGKHQRHTFLFSLGKGRIFKALAKVRPGREVVDLVLTADHVKESIKDHGVGNTMTCAMTKCVEANAAIFPHTFRGYCDWTYTRCYAVSKVDARGMPSECYCYTHNDGIGKLNDSPGGQRKLLRQLIEQGPRTIRLHPMRIRFGTTRTGRGQYDGSRSSKPKLVGAHLRYAVAHLGLRGVEVSEKEQVQ